jgi:hypothetical protein
MVTKKTRRNPVRSGHGDTVKRKLTAAQRRTLKNRGQVAVTITLGGKSYHKTVRRRNVRNGCWEYYRRSDNDYAPSLRDYKRDYLKHSTGGKGYRHAGRGHDRT